MSSTPFPLSRALQEPGVGIFWFVDHQLVAAGAPVRLADIYGDNATYVGGHAEHWAHWARAGSRWLKEHRLPLSILTSEYDEHPRGRIVYARKSRLFRLYADMRLHADDPVAEIRNRFGIAKRKTQVFTDSHYR